MLVTSVNGQQDLHFRHCQHIDLEAIVHQFFLPLQPETNCVKGN